VSLSEAIRAHLAPAERSWLLGELSKARTVEAEVALDVVKVPHPGLDTFVALEARRMAMSLRRAEDAHLRVGEKLPRSYTSCAARRSAGSVPSVSASMSSVSRVTFERIVSR